MWRFIAVCFLFAACTGESLYDNINDDGARLRRQNHHPQQPEQTQLQQINYRPYNEAPDRIKQLLQLQQAREPLVHLPAQSHPQLQAASAPGLQRTPAPQQHLQPQLQSQQPLIQPAQYNPQVQYNQAPPQPTYKGAVQAIQAGVQQPNPPPNAQNYYTPQYKPQYAQPAPANALPTGNYRPLAGPPAPAGPGQYRAAAALQQFPKNLPPHIQKIIESQRAYQGGPMSPILRVAYDKTLG